MKIKCIKIYNEQTKEYQEKSSWITVGKEYIVLAIELRLDIVSFLIQSDSNDQPVLQNVSQFEIITKKIPTNWKISPGTLELLTIGPISWREAGFWEDCYDGKPSALEIYKREARIIFEDENSQ
ncbi:MAG: hypothetical protein P4M12_07715 [Gammaproteobacteria bacterium]|nr:hypothetical protein [Gammaproteobacteria bacterium]